MTFLRYIAQELLSKYGDSLHNVTVVFPNKRASLFLNKHLTELSTKPLWSPHYSTISELFRQYSTLQVADRVKLIYELYRSYIKVTGSDESLDMFYNWGELMLSDFDDIDKHLADARQIFTLLGDIHEMDATDYLSDEQVKVLQSFFRNFSKEHNSILKQRFLDLWSKLYDIYADYHERLMQQGIAYEGMMYRDVIENAKVNGLSSASSATDGNEGRIFIFVGFNLLTPVEQLLITNTGGKIYHDDDNSAPPREVTFMSSPTDDLQARYIHQWLTPERINAGRKTAIVLADESLLETVLHSIPSGIKLNITTGYPLSKASITSLVKVVCELLIKKHYTLHNVNAVLRHPLISHLSPKAHQLHEQLNKDMLYYLKPEQLYLDNNLTLLFAPLATTPAADADHKQTVSTEALTERLLWMVKTIAKNVNDNEVLSESLYRMYTLLNRMMTLVREENIDLSLPLYGKLLQQVIQATSIPFHGEPIEGIQVMGVLETRNLDFDHVLLLSCNDGKMPAKVNDTSFIPHSVRQAYSLTTIENKISIYEYYFDRLLQRADNVTITYNNSTSGSKTGEMSRFMLQLLVQRGKDIKRCSLEGTIDISQNRRKEIAKTPEMISRLLEKKFLSPSLLGAYLRCQMKFYYQYILGIRDDDLSDEEEMDMRAFGNIFHKTAELLYKDYEGKIVPHSYLDSLLKEKDHTTIKNTIEKAMRSEYFNIKDDSIQTPRLGGLQLINFEMVLRFILNMIRYDLSLTRLEIVNLEHTVTDTIEVKTAEGTIDVNIGGNIDRLDMVTDEDGVRRMRIIDYKTGNAKAGKALNNDSIASIFDREKMAAHADYFLQALLYGSIIDRQNATSDTKQEVSLGLLYVKNAAKENYSPLLQIEGMPITNASEYVEEFREELSSLISDILNPEIPFRHTSDNGSCRNCPFINFCE